MPLFRMPRFLLVMPPSANSCRHSATFYSLTGPPGGAKWCRSVSTLVTRKTPRKLLYDANSCQQASEYAATPQLARKRNRTALSRDFKSFHVQEDDHLLIVCRYIERNPLRARLVPRAELWPWSSFARRVYGRGLDLLDAWPVPVPADRREQVNGVQTAGELAAVRKAARRGSPFGTTAWQQETARRLGLEGSLKPLDRPRKRTTEVSISAALFDVSSHPNNPQ